MVFGVKIIFRGFLKRFCVPASQSDSLTQLTQLISENVQSTYRKSTSINFPNHVYLVRKKKAVVYCYKMLFLDVFE